MLLGVSPAHDIPHHEQVVGIVAQKGPQVTGLEVGERVGYAVSEKSGWGCAVLTCVCPVLCVLFCQCSHAALPAHFPLTRKGILISLSIDPLCPTPSCCCAVDEGQLLKLQPLHPRRGKLSAAPHLLSPFIHPSVLNKQDVQSWHALERLSSSVVL